MIYLPTKYEPEILEPKILVTSARPFGMETVYAEAPVGLSLSQILWNGPCPHNLPITVEAWIDGKPVPCELWDFTYPQKGQLVAFKAFPQGGALRTILMVLVMIIAVVVAILVPGLGTALGVWAAGSAWGVFAGAVAGIAVSVIGNLLINAFVPVKTPRQGDFGGTNDAPTQWISGAQNTINKWGSIPVILGSHRTTPFYGAKPYTEIVGNEQFLRCLFVIGYGPLQITDLKLGEASIDQFSNVQIEIRSGYADDTPITLIPNQVEELGLSILLNAGVWNSRTTEPDCDRFSIDWVFPSGLARIYQATGTKLPWIVELGVQYRKVGDEAWTNVGAALAVPAAMKQLQSSYRMIYSYSLAVVRIDLVCIGVDTGEVQVFQGIGNLLPRSDVSSYYELAAVVIVGNRITFIQDRRNGAFITGCAVSVADGLTLYIASGSVGNPNRVVTIGATTSAVRRSLTIIPPERGQYEIRVSRGTPDNSEITIIDKVYWSVLRSIMQEHPINFPHPLALVAVRIKATDQLAGMVDNFNCVATSIIKDYDGGSNGSLLHFNGANGATTFVDEYGHVWIAGGTAQLSTTTPKFGSAKLLLDGDSDYIKTTGLTPPRSKFTIEGAFYTGDKTQQNQTIFHAWGTNQTGIFLAFNLAGNGKLALSLASVPGSWDIANSVLGSRTSWADDTWYKWCIEFTDSKYSVYVGEYGSPVTQDISVVSSVLVEPLTSLELGAYYDFQYWLKGGFDEVRMLFGDCRYNIIFTPEIAEFATWVEKPTNNPASLYRYVLQGSPNTKPQPDTKLDLGNSTAFFEDFWQWCVDKGFAYNAVTASAKSVFEQIVEICSAGRCTPQRIEGKWAGVIDRPRAIITGHYTPHNSWNLEFGGAFPQLPHGIRVAFLDETHDYQQQERIVYNDGYDVDNATLFEAVAQQGITNPDQIFKLWRYNIACTKLRPFPFSFMVDWEHLTNTRGDLIRIGYYELSGQLFSGRLKIIEEVTGNHVLTLDNTVIMAEGKSYAIRIRQQNGTTLTGNILTDPGEVTTITTDGLLAQVPNIGDLFQFGELQAESIPAIIKSIEPVDKLCAKINCLDYAPAVFSADTEPIPGWDPIVTLPYLADSRPAVPIIINVISDESVIQRDPGGRFKFRIAVNFRYLSSTKVNAQYVQCQYALVTESTVERWETTGNVSALAGVVFIPDVQEGGQYQIRIRALTSTGISSEWSSIRLETVVGRTSIPDTVTGLDYAFTENGVLFTWDRLTSIDINHYELRRGGTGWADAITIAKVDSNSYEWGWRTAGNYTIRIKAVDFLGLESEDTIPMLMTIINPQKPTNLQSRVIHNQVNLSWECIAGSFPISFYNIFKNTVLVGTVGGNFISFFETAEGSYTYSIVAVDTVSNQGVEESIIVYVDEPFGFVSGYDQALTLSGGVFTNALYDSGAHSIYIPIDVASSYDNVMDDWESWQAKITAGYPYWLQPTLATGQWLSDAIDLGEVISTSRITIVLSTTVLVAGCTVTTYIQHSLNGSDWTEVEGNQIIASNFRYFRTRITVTQAGTTGLVKLS